MEEQFTPSLDTKPFGTPLLRFRGNLKEYVSERRKDEGSGREYMIITFNFTDLDVLASTEPYAFPIASIGVGYSTTENTRWDVLAKSIKKLFGRTPALDEIVQKNQEWWYGDCKLTKREDSGAWILAPDNGWQIVSIDGLGSPAQATADIDAHVLDLLDGKNEQDFQQVFFIDSEIRKHPELIEQATNRQLLPALESAGRAYRDDAGVWHRGPKPA